MHVPARVKETTTSTGTGNLVTSSVAGFRTGDAATAVNVRFPYYIEHESDNTWESGIGYKSDATTLVRERVNISSSGRGVAVNFAAGTKTIFCDFSEHHIVPAWPGVYGTNKDIGPSNVTFNLASAMTVTADRLYLLPFRLDIALTLTHLVASVDGAVAASKARFGLYRWLPNGDPGSLIVETADVDTATTGTKVSAVTNTFLLPGWYLAACVNSAAVSYLASGRTEMSSSPVGGGGYNVSLYQTLTAGWTNLPSPPTVSGVGDIWGGSCPGVYLRGTL